MSLDFLFSSLIFNARPSFGGVFVFGHTVQDEGVVPPGTESLPPAVEAWNCSHWTAKEVPRPRFLTTTEILLFVNL